jgi:SAM-dependent methyltransferase
MTQDDRRCDICGGSLETAIVEARDAQTGDRFSVLRCVDCGLGHTQPLPARLDPYYGPAYHGGRHGVSERFCMSRRLRFVRSVGSARRLLDFGCGDGGFLEAASAAGLEAVGVELESRHARAKGLRVVERLDELPGSFDVLTLWHSLEHVPSPLETMTSALAHLDVGGHVIVAVPNFASLQAAVFGSRWFHLDVPRHLHHFTRRSLETLFARLGVEPVRSWATESEIDLFGWTQSALNAAFPSHPNVLFDVLTRRSNAHGWGETAASFALGTIVTVLAAPLLPIAGGAARGAVLVLAGRKRAGLPA